MLSENVFSSQPSAMPPANHRDAIESPHPIYGGNVYLLKVVWSS